MSQIVKPVLFSQHFGISPAAFENAELIEPILNADTKLFIDPLLLTGSRNTKIKNEAYPLLKKRFGEIIQLVEASQAVGDVAWRNAAKRLDLSERPETCLGYGAASIGGNSRPDEIKEQILSTAKEIINLGENNPEIISLMGLFEEGVGPDTVSDMATTFIMPILAEITETFCKANNVLVKLFPKYGNRALPENPFRPNVPVLLVPRDILRDLPLANDRGDVSRVIAEVAQIRDAFNAMVSDITKATLAELKRTVKNIALSSLKVFRDLFEAVLNSSSSYDPNEDIFGFYKFRQVLASDPAAFKTKIRLPTEKNESELIRVVQEIIKHFAQLVEHNNMWELLWTDEKPRRERAAQLVFFAVADIFCRANNIDISPEMNAGGGPVDFKFSTGYDRRVLVEIKMSTGQVVHGYEKQLEIYKDASKTAAAIFLVVNVGGMKEKYKTIRAIEKQRLADGNKASEIILVDALPKKSASKR